MNSTNVDDSRAMNRVKTPQVKKQETTAQLVTRLVLAYYSKKNGVSFKS